MIHFFNRLHLLVVFFWKWQSLKHTFLLFLGHLSFVLLQCPLQVLVLLLGPAEGGHRSKGQMCQGNCRGGGAHINTHTCNTVRAAANVAVPPVEWPSTRGRAPTFHPPGTLLADSAANLEGIPPMQVCCCCRACRMTAGCRHLFSLCLRFLWDRWKCKDSQQTLSR